MMSDQREEECYEQFAEWLFHQIARIKQSRLVGTFRIVTDDKPGLYNPFIKIFDAVHGLCYIHLEKSFMR